MGQSRCIFDGYVNTLLRNMISVKNLVRAAVGREQKIILLPWKKGPGPKISHLGPARLRYATGHTSEYMKH